MAMQRLRAPHGDGSIRSPSDANYSEFYIVFTTVTAISECTATGVAQLGVLTAPACPAERSGGHEIRRSGSELSRGKKKGQKKFLLDSNNKPLAFA